MIYDTDILIWVERGNSKAAALIDQDDDKFLSIQRYMELLQGARNKAHHKSIKNFVCDFNFSILLLTENIGHRALIYVEEHVLCSSMCSGDAIIAATAVEFNMVLISSNAKHFKVVKDLQLQVFKP
jgi:predicted nucleic acid-binding protein